LRNLIVRGITLIILVLTAGCLSRQTIEYQELNRAIDDGHPPLIIAVLPFEDQTENDGLATLIRESFYSHFSVRSYQDVELHVVDQRLSHIIFHPHNDYPLKALQEIGRLVKCDAVISGALVDFQRIYAGVYSQIKIEVAVSVWDTRSGRRLWTDQHIERRHEGGVPFGIEEIPLIAIRSGLNLVDKEKVTVVDKLCRHLAVRIPAPRKQGPHRSHQSEWVYEIQAGAFINPVLASKLLHRIRRNGYPAYIRTYRDTRGEWHRVQLGPYEDQEEALQVREQVNGFLEKDAFITRVPVSSSKQ
jgi:hypothetical protein